MKKDTVLKRIQKIIADAQLEYDYSEELHTFRTEIDTKDGDPLILLGICVSDHSIITYTGFRYIVTEETRDQVLIFINYINNNTCDGKLILETERDTIFFLNHEDFHTRPRITDKELKDIIFSGVCIIDDISRLLMSIIDGEITAEETYEEMEEIMMESTLEWVEYGYTIPSEKRKHHYPISPEEYFRLEFQV